MAKNRMRFPVLFPFTVPAMKTAIAMFIDPEMYPNPTAKQCTWALRMLYRQYGMGWDEHVISKDEKRYDWALKAIKSNWNIEE